MATTAHPPQRCVCCGKEATLSVQLSEGLNRPPMMVTRYYLATDKLRAQSQSMPDAVTEVAFCQPCLDRVEDSVRATILYLQTQNGVVAVRSVAESKDWV